MQKRLFIVSNRLPLSIDEEKGIQQASGGLITAINSYLSKISDDTYDEVFWAGAPGCFINTWAAASKKIKGNTFTYLPVFIQDQEYQGYYNGHSNSVIWPLFHYFPSYAEYNVEAYECYQKVNTQFAEVLLKNLRPSDIVWIHDYHLLPLAAVLRKEIPELTIGFFLHIPFPSYEIFRLLPKKWQEEMLKGMLGADLIGFHTIDYAAHFLQSVQMVLGHDHERHVLHYDNRLIKVDVFPISIDFEKFHEAFSDRQVASRRESLLEQMNNCKIIFSVDRLDYTKGVQNRLKAYEYFLEENPHYHGKVVFIMVIVPSRDTIPKYVERKRMINELISHINSKIGNIHWMPVIYQYNFLEFENMVALYSSCDLALITPLRDGMNLVSKEFVASRKDKKGVLIISEMAGAARELTDALTINPNDILEMAQKIKEGLEMNIEEQGMRLTNMQKRISSYNVKAWVDDFMTALDTIKNKQASFQIKFLDEYTRRTLHDAYRNAKKRLLILDYDGTLVPFSSNPEMAVPGPDLIALLNNLSATEENDILLISGRSSSWLEKHFGFLPLNLVGEHGAQYKLKNKQWVSEIQTNNDWKERVHTIMEMYVRRCANTLIEEKEFSMVWHYRNASVGQGALRAFELARELDENIRGRHLQLVMGNKIVEIRQRGINKGRFVKKLIHKENYDYIFAAGDDRTDEDMFKALIDTTNTFTFKVGPEASYAKYNLHTPQMVVSLLEGMRHLTFPTLIP